MKAKGFVAEALKRSGQVAQSRRRRSNATE